MRRSRRLSRPRIRRKARGLDWIVGVNTVGTSETTVVEDGVTDGSQALFTLIDSTDVVDHEHHLTVLRVVGDFSYAADAVRNSVGTSLGPYVPFLRAGIIVQSIDAAGDVQQLSFDSAASVDQELSWMWLKDGPAGDTPFFYRSDGGTATNPLGTPVSAPGEILPLAWSFHLDLKVKRRMGERQELVFWAQVLNATGGFAAPSADAQLTYVWQSTMRVLVSQNSNNPAGGNP